MSPKISSVERTEYGDPVGWRNKQSPFILVGSDGSIAQAQTITDKRRLLDEAMNGDSTLLLPWVGRYSTTVFVVDDYERAAEGLAPG